jgi:hypothetical protein
MLNQNKHRKEHAINNMLYNAVSTRKKENLSWEDQIANSKRLAEID